jgi:Flp pilus assembly pilin Flp
MNKLRKLLRRQSGQGMTEYVIIVALIAIAAIGVVTVFGDNIRALFGAATDSLAGKDTATAQTATAGKKADHKTLKDFASDTTSKGEGGK